MPDADRSQGPPRTSGLTGKAVAVSMSLLLAAVAVGSLALLAVDYHRSLNHQKACTAYRDAMTLNLAVDVIPDPSAQGLVTDSPPNPNQGLDRADATRLRNQIGYYTMLFHDALQKLPDEQPLTTLHRQWSAWAGQFFDQAMAKQGC